MNSDSWDLWPIRAKLCATMIDSDEGARRLARAIVADIRLYNVEAIKQNADVSESIDEGRKLFHTRVSAALHGIYEEALNEAGLQTAGSVPAATAASMAALPAGLFEDPKPKQRTSGTRVVLLFVALVTVGVVVWLLL